MVTTTKNADVKIAQMPGVFILTAVENKIEREIFPATNLGTAPKMGTAITNVDVTIVEQLCFYGVNLI
jgi:hypothetical protein